MVSFGGNDNNAVAMMIEKNNMSNFRQFAGSKGPQMYYRATRFSSKMLGNGDWTLNLSMLLPHSLFVNEQSLIRFFLNAGGLILWFKGLAGYWSQI